MRLLRAELRKLRRPLTLWVLGLGTLLSVVLAWGGLTNDHDYLASPGYRAPAPVSCADLGLPGGPDCARQLAVYQRVATAGVKNDIATTLRAIRRSAVLDVYIEQPLGAGAMAGGLMASLPGLALIALLAAGHAGGEWTGRTLKTVLAVEGRRWRFLMAKALSLWLASVLLLALAWAALAAATPVWRAAFPLPVHHPSLQEQWAHTWPVLWHAVLTLAVFSALAVTAAVLTRSVVGTLTATVGTILAALIAAGFRTVSDWSPATWVSAWTRFPAQANVVTSFWARVSGQPTRAGLQQPHLGWAAALLCLTGFTAACWTISVVWLRRTDIA
jgi:hypothetical protein